MLQMFLTSFYAELGHLALSGSNCITWGESVEEEDKCAEGRTLKSRQKAEENNPFWTDWEGTVCRVEGKPRDSLANLASIKSSMEQELPIQPPAFLALPVQVPGVKENSVLCFPGLMW